MIEDDEFPPTGKDRKYMCWKLDLYLNKSPFKSIKSLLVDKRDEHETVELIDDYRKD